MSTVVRPFRGVSAEQRLAQRRADLLEAGLDEIAAVGVAQLRMSSVCERAGLTQRYFYEHFRNRDHLLDALHETMISNLITRTVAAVEAEPLDLLVRARVAVATFLDFFAEEPRRARLYTEAATLPTLAARKAEGIKRYAEQAARQVCAVYGETDPKTHARIALAALVVVHGNSAVTLAWHNGEIDIARDEYVELLAQIFVDALVGVHQH
ncbi:TetR/AcrR family transcriptional regulator [Nocardia sp. NPDC050175]|uniref:TetR/AcrR family transcriptional regulator n=1 Tax=Nocardia sp. NPDC050175 TaxID=3364317 RepID=UPI0037A72833